MKDLNLILKYINNLLIDNRTKAERNKQILLNKVDLRVRVILAGSPFCFIDGCLRQFQGKFIITK